MQRYSSYLHQKLDTCYAPEEINAMSRLLLNKLANMTSVQIYSDKDRVFSDETFSNLASAIDELAEKRPIQYVLGETEFCGLTFKVRPGVLIPRPETEELVDRIVSDHLERKNLSILDIGTGSGCIAVSLAKLLPGSHVSAWDVSSEALEIAQENALSNAVHVAFSQIDVLSHRLNETQKGTLDILASNPPYVRYCEATEMDANVLEYEPHVALFVENEDPLLFYRTISKLAIDLLKPGGSLYFEINSYLGSETLDLIRSFPFREVCLLQDIFGKDRMIKAIR